MYIMSYRRLIDIQYLEAALVITNKDTIERNFPFIVNKDKSYNCPSCGKFFEPVFQYSRFSDDLTLKTNPHAKKHYMRINCLSRSDLLKHGYIRNDEEDKVKGKFNKKKPLLSPAVLKVLHLYPYNISICQEVAIKVLRKEATLDVDFTQTYQPRNLHELKRIRQCSLVTPIIQRKIDIPNVKVELSENNVQSIYSQDRPNFTSLDHIKVFVRNAIALDRSYSWKELMLYMPCIRASEIKRKRNDDLTSGMEEYLEYINYDYNSTPKRRRVGLLSDES